MVTQYRNRRYPKTRVKQTNWSARTISVHCTHQSAKYSQTVELEPKTRIKRPLADRVYYRLFRWAGCTAPDTILDEINEAVAARRTPGRSHWSLPVWKFYQSSSVVLYQVRDNSPALSLKGWHPFFALQLAMRSFRHEISSAVTAAGTLAIGFGAAAAIFSVLTGFTGPLPVPHGDKVVRITARTDESSNVPLIAETMLQISGRQTTLSDMGFFQVQRAVVLAEGLAPVRVPLAAMSHEVFRLLNVPPLIGRLPEEFSDREDQDVVVISQRLASMIANDLTQIIGKELNVAGRPRRLIAVMPDGFGFPFGEDAWIPFDVARSDGSFEVVARLAEGATEESASLELSTLAGSSQAEADGTRLSFTVEGFTESRGESGEDVALIALLIIVVALLAVSAANVSNLLLVRALERSRTMAVHSALGAGPAQVVTQLFAEALAIAVGGAVLGMGIALATVSVIEGNLSGHWGYYWMKVQVDLPVVLFTLALSVLVALIAGTTPAIRALRSDLAQPLRQDTSGSGGAKPGWFAWSLVSGQIAFSVVALITSSMMAAGLLRSSSVNPAFPANSVWVSSVTLHAPSYDTPEQRLDFQRSLLSSAAPLSSVEHIALSTGLPGLNSPAGVLEIDGRAPDPDARPTTVLTFGVTEDYFTVFNIAKRQGRLFQEGDQTAPETVVVVSSDFATRHFPDEDPVGRHIKINGVTPGDDWANIVGVVEDVSIYESQGQARRDWVYLPSSKAAARTLYVLYRPVPGQTNATADLQAVVSEIDPFLPLDGTMGSDRATPVAAVLRFVRILLQIVGSLSILAGVGATLVAGFGLYGVLAFEVRRKTPEIGIRMALGAGQGKTLFTIVRSGVFRILPGLGIGLVLSYFLTPAFGVFLGTVDPHNPGTFITIALSFVAIALVASFVPAQRAARLDPARVLRSE